jgi:hypothetical protein
MKFLSRLQALLAALFTRTFEATLPNGAQVNVWVRERVVLPVIQGGAPEGDGAGAGDGGDGSDDGDADGADEGDGDGDGHADGAEGKEKDAEYWREQHRRYERTIKRKRTRDKQELKEAKDKLKEREDEDKSEQEKAVEKAREEGKTEALTTAEKERRKDRLESAVTRAAGKKIKIGEGDDAKEVRFEDPEDAEVFLQRKIAKGDLDEDDLYDSDGKVKAEVVAEALQEILEEKPRLAEDSGSGEPEKKTAKGGVDQRKGDGSEAGKDLEEMSPEEHEKRKDAGA